ncbi:ATP-binding cassette domain-containing protein [Sphingomonas sp. 66-10]|uniref:ATP-binding cassette domain-containing protein n=1 Tax=Sphingomonas sp. 66-10 TaxID=1895848 RepID=UPI00257B1721|nr:ATP-binding cassette domain-containing protein [Sphingomonas sp. 66-10]
MLAILRTAGRYFERLLSHQAALGTLASLRTTLFARAAAAEASGRLRLSGGEGASLLGRDVDQLEDRVIRGPQIAGAFAGLLFAVFLAAVTGIIPALCVVLCLAGACVMTSWLARRMLPDLAQCEAAASNDLKVALAEYAAAAGEIAVYDLTARVSAELEQVAARHDDAQFRLARAEAAIATIPTAAAGIACALALATAHGGAALAAMAALAAIAAGESIAGYARAQIRAPSVDEASARLDKIAAVGLPDPVSASPAVPGLTIITSVGTHRLMPGARVAIAGPSGCGKTRLLGTLAGLRTDAPQEIIVGERAASEMGLYRLRQQFALVPQDPMLIAGTILDNLRLARAGIGEDEIWEALSTACLDQEVRALPDRLDQWIGEDGAQLSGGQRKRLAMARGLLAARPWLLLDEPSEGLDANTEAKLVARLRDWFDRSGQGLLLVSHRAAPLSLCDKTIGLAGDHPRK